jgi:hypothetical protein
LQRGDKGNAQVIAEVRPRSADILARLYDAEKFLKKLVFDLEISPVIIPVALPRPGPGHPDGFVSLHHLAEPSRSLGIVRMTVRVTSVCQNPEPAADILPTGSG